MGETKNKEFNSFAEFYPYYLSKHMRCGTKIAHCIGTIGFVVLLVVAVLLQRWVLGLMGIAFAYGFAWVSHFFVEQNRPATFRYPLYSLMGDFKMCFEILTQKRSLNSEKQ
ncbi:MAG: Mpo1-like protein [Pseudomonadales bacterium]